MRKLNIVPLAPAWVPTEPESAKRLRVSPRLLGKRVIEAFVGASVPENDVMIA